MTKMNSKTEGNTLGILRRSFFPFNALGMPSFNNSVPLALKGIIRIGKITLSAQGITDEITDNHPIDICSVL